MHTELQKHSQNPFKWRQKHSRVQFDGHRWRTGLSGTINGDSSLEIIFSENET